MAITFLKCIQSNPTAGLTDGTIVSSGDSSAPISVALNATTNEISSSIKLALRADTGYATQGNTTIIPSGTTASKWALSLDNITWQPYGSSITITGSITPVNTIFYARCKSTSDELPANDQSVDISVSAVVISTT